MDRKSVKWMSLNRLRKFMLSKDFRNSDWALDCLFPPITHHNLDDHPLVVAQKIASRRRSSTVLWWFFIGGIITGLAKAGINLEIEPLFISLFCFFGSIFCLLEFIMTPDEKRSLKECRKRWELWEKFLGESLLVSIQRRGCFAIEHLIEKRLVETAKELIKIERANAPHRKTNSLNSFNIGREKLAREMMEDFHGLVRYTNLVPSQKWDIYFRKANESLDKEEAAEKKEQEKRGEPVCDGCGG